MAMGWHWYLDKLGAELDGGPAPTDWDAFVAEVGPAYGDRLTRRPSTPIAATRRAARPAATIGVSTGSKPPGGRGAGRALASGSPGPSARCPATASTRRARSSGPRRSRAVAQAWGTSM